MVYVLNREGNPLMPTTRGRWFDIAKKFDMKAEVIDSMCGMK